METFCILCTKDAGLLCQRCREPYCSRQCQQDDWPNHKMTCFPMPGLVNKKSPESGKPQNISNGSSEPLSPLRPPKTRLPNGCEIAPTDLNENRKLFQNPFKRNSENISFKCNDVKNKTSILDKSATNNYPKRNSESSSPAKATVKEEPIDTTSTKVLSKPVMQETVVKRQPIDLNARIAAIREPSLEKGDGTQSKLSKPVQVQPEVKEIVPKVMEPWMKTAPIDQKDSVTLIVQHVDPDGKIWAMNKENAMMSNNLLREINKGISSATRPELHEVKVDQLFRCPFEDIYYRGVVLEPVTAAATVLIRLIDYGNEVVVPIGELKSAIPGMRKLNAFAFPIKFEKERKIKVDDTLNVKITTMKDDVMIVTEEGEADNPVTTMKDIDIVPCSGTKLYCLDFTNIKKGYISACVNDLKAIARIDSLTAKISDYCKRQHQSYSPVVGELCLGMFEDKQWYRALVLKVVGSKFEIMFIDFGNIASVTSKELCKIPEEFTHPCLMNKCNIKDFPLQPTQEYIMKIAKFFNNDPMFEVSSLEKGENGTYVIEPKFE